MIGNHDAHAKNFSLLYLPDCSMRLAPLYDPVSSVYYPELTGKMAMKIGNTGKSALLHPRDVDSFARRAGLGAAPTRARIPVLADRVLEKIPGIVKTDPVSESLAKLIAKRCEDYRSRFSKK